LCIVTKITRILYIKCSGNVSRQGEMTRRHDWSLLAILCVVCHVGLTTGHQDGDYTLDIMMDHAVAHQPDDLVCTARKLEQGESYIIKLSPHADKSTAHHMMLFGCKLPANQNFTKPWSCDGYNDMDSPVSVCRGGSRKILFAWALNAPEKSLPDGVGLRVGGDTGIQYLVTQLHYAKKFPEGVTDGSGYTVHITRDRPEQQAGYIIIGGDGTIPPQQPEFHMESMCVYNRSYPIYPIGYRTHSHKLGVVTAGYRIRNGEWTEIGRMSPQLPQTFYPVTHPDMDIQPGDYLAGRCTMNSMSRHQDTVTGPRNEDEMCNFYILYSTYHQGPLTDQFCFSHTRFSWSEVFPSSHIPPDASSLTDIPGAGRVRDIFHLKPK